VGVKHASFGQPEHSHDVGVALEEELGELLDRVADDVELVLEPDPVLELLEADDGLGGGTTAIMMSTSSMWRGSAFGTNVPWLIEPMLAAIRQFWIGSQACGKASRVLSFQSAGSFGGA